MSEDYRIVEVRGEPLAADRVGVRVRVQLSGCPSGRWSRDVSARLAGELVCHAAVGHLRLNEIVQGDQIVLEGVRRARRRRWPTPYSERSTPRTRRWQEGRARPPMWRKRRRTRSPRKSRRRSAPR